MEPKNDKLQQEVRRFSFALLFLLRRAILATGKRQIEI